MSWPHFSSHRALSTLKLIHLYSSTIMVEYLLTSWSMLMTFLSLATMAGSCLPLLLHCPLGFLSKIWVLFTTSLGLKYCLPLLALSYPNINIYDLLVRTNMAGAKEATTTLSTTTSLTISDGSASMDASEFRSVVGSLQYLSLSLIQT